MLERVTDINETLRRIPEDKAASSQEIVAAIERLQNTELIKLERYARYRIRGLGRKAGGRDHDDLVKEALLATLSGQRRWNKEVEFYAHLLGVIRSISSHWREKYAFDGALLESESHFTPPGQESSWLASVSSPEPDAERVASARQEVQRITQYFAADSQVTLIIEGLRDGLTGPEIQAQQGMPRTEYESAVRRMRRGLEAMARKGEKHGQYH
jgi:DNA-directed RNA polymerase specialized sigma24 family protein